MELLQDPMFLIVAWLVLTGLTQLAKRRGIPQKEFTLSLAMLMWVAYWVFTTFVSVDMQDKVFVTMTGILWSSKIIYDFVTSLMDSAKVASKTGK